MQIQQTHEFAQRLRKVKDIRAQARIYFTRRGAELVVLLLCGDKASQELDIRLAKALAKTL